MLLEIKSETKLLICEGREERSFFRALCQARGNMDFLGYAVTVIGGEDEDNAPKGIGGLSEHLRSVTVVTGVRQKITDFVLLADSDDSESESFKVIQNQIKNANTHPDVNERYPVPTRPFVKQAGVPSFTVILQPAPKGTGCLETLLMENITSCHANEAACVEALMRCAKLEESRQGWTKSKIDKAKVRSAIAILNEENPARPLTQLWKYERDIIPLGHGDFTPVYNALAAI